MFCKLNKEDKKDRLTQVLRFLKYKSGLNQQELAVSMGRSQSYVKHILVGDRSLSFVDWHSWLSALGSDEEEFLGLLNEGVGIEEDWTKP